MLLPSNTKTERNSNRKTDAPMRFWTFSSERAPELPHQTIHMPTEPPINAKAAGSQISMTFSLNSRLTLPAPAAAAQSGQVSVKITFTGLVQAVFYPLGETVRRVRQMSSEPGTNPAPSDNHSIVVCYLSISRAYLRRNRDIPCSVGQVFSQRSISSRVKSFSLIWRNAALELSRLFTNS